MTGHTGRRGQEQHDGDHAGRDQQGAVHGMDQQAPARSLEGDAHAGQGEREDAEGRVRDGSLPHEVGEPQVGQELADRALESRPAARPAQPDTDGSRDDRGAEGETGERAGHPSRAALRGGAEARERQREDDPTRAVRGL